MLILRHRGMQLLLESVFDQVRDEYSSTYRVFVLPDIPDAELKGSWENLSSKALKCLGEVAVKDVTFDATRRQQIDTAVLDEMV